MNKNIDSNVILYSYVKYHNYYFFSGCYCCIKYKVVECYFLSFLTIVGGHWQKLTTATKVLLHRHPLHISSPSPLVFQRRTISSLMKLTCKCAIIFHINK